MPKITFHQNGVAAEVDGKQGSKILATAIRNKVPIRYGCGACSCGTCAVKVSDLEALSSMEEDERILLEKIDLSLKGDIRLSCRARLTEKDLEIDLNFQDTYSPDRAGIKI